MQIYGLKRKSLGKIVYVGITRWTAERRFQRHVALSGKIDPKTRLHRAIKKYGAKDFEVTILAETNNLDVLKAGEQFYIGLYKTFWKDGGYNLTIGGDGSFGHKQPQWAIEKRRKLITGNSYGKGHHHTEEAKRRIGKASKTRPGGMSGKHHTDEARAKIGMRRGEKHHYYGKKRDPETIEKMRIAATGRNVSDETRRKLSEIHSGKPKSIEHRAALSAASKGRPKSEAHKAALKKAWERRRVNVSSQVI